MSHHKIQINDNSNETNSEVNNSPENVSQLQSNNTNLSQIPNDQSTNAQSTDDQSNNAQSTNAQSNNAQSTDDQSNNAQSTDNQSLPKQQSKLLPTAKPIGSATATHTFSNPAEINQSYPVTFAHIPNDTTYLSTHYVETAPESPNLQLTWQYAKTIKCISLIDIFFLILNSLIAWPFIIFLIGPICGYYGSKKYEFNKIFIYLK